MTCNRFAAAPNRERSKNVAFGAFSCATVPVLSVVFTLHVLEGHAPGQAAHNDGYRQTGMGSQGALSPPASREFILWQFKTRGSEV